MNPQIRVSKNLETLSVAAAEIFAAAASQSIAERGRFLAALNGGGTPQRLFQLLASDFSARVDWTRVHVFWGDERMVPPDDPESSYGLARTLLLDRVAIPKDNVHRVHSELDAGAAVEDYSRVLKRFASPPLDWPRFDLVLLGMGEDGHTASLFPNSPVDASAPVLAATGRYQGRPAQRVTLTPIVFNAARQVVFMVSGAGKAEMLKRVFDDRYSMEEIPAKRIQPTDGQVIWLADEAAGADLALTPNPSPDERGEQ